MFWLPKEQIVLIWCTRCCQFCCYSIVYSLWVFLCQMSSLEVSLNILYLIKQEANKQRINGHFCNYSLSHFTRSNLIKKPSHQCTCTSNAYFSRFFKFNVDLQKKGLQTLQRVARYCSKEVEILLFCLGTAQKNSNYITPS